MQMRKYCYENGTESQRIAQMRADGEECARRGFQGVAEVNFEMAAWLIEERKAAELRAERRRLRAGVRRNPNVRQMNTDDGEQTS